MMDILKDQKKKLQRKLNATDIRCQHRLNGEHMSCLALVNEDISAFKHGTSQEDLISYIGYLEGLVLTSINTEDQNNQ